MDSSSDVENNTYDKATAEYRQEEDQVEQIRVMQV